MFSYLGIDNPVSQILPCSRQQRQKLPSDEYFSNNAPIIAVLKENKFYPLVFYGKHIFREEARVMCFLSPCLLPQDTEETIWRTRSLHTIQTNGWYWQFSLHPPLRQSPGSPLTINPHPCVSKPQGKHHSTTLQTQVHTQGHKQGSPVQLPDPRRPPLSLSPGSTEEQKHGHGVPAVPTASIPVSPASRLWVIVILGGFVFPLPKTTLTEPVGCAGQEHSPWRQMAWVWFKGRLLASLSHSYLYEKG